MCCMCVCGGGWVYHAGYSTNNLCHIAGKIRQLLTHTAGLGYVSEDPDLGRWTKHVGRKESDLTGTIEMYATPLKFTPGQGWYYGSGLDWAGPVIEKITGQTLGAYMAEHLFGPLGMGDTAFRRDILPQVRDRTVLSSHRDRDTGELAASDEAFPIHARPQFDSGGAGMYTTAVDYSRLLQALLRSLSGDDGALLKKETVEEMFRPQMTDVQKQWLEFMAGLFHDGFASDFGESMPLDYGISGAINMKDEPGKRRKGSMMWGGLCNAHWVRGNLSCSVSSWHNADGDAVHRYGVRNRGHICHQRPTFRRRRGDQSLGCAGARGVQRSSPVCWSLMTMLVSAS